MKKNSRYTIASGLVVTANSQSNTFDMDAMVNLCIYIIATAVGGTTPNLATTLQTSPDGGTTWVDHPDVTFAAITANASQMRTLRGAGGALGRFNFTVTGTTPTFTLQIQVIGQSPDNQ